MPVQTAVVTSDGSAAIGNQYTRAGWIAIAQAIIFAVSFAFGIAEVAFGVRFIDLFGDVVIQVSDSLMLAFTVMAVYTISKLRHLFRECHDYTGIDTLLLASIWWVILFEAGTLFFSGARFVFGSVPDFVAGIVLASFFGVAMITIGIVDIIIGIRLLREQDRFSQLIKSFAYVSLITGIAEASLIFLPVALLLVPVSCLIMGLIFLRDNHDVEFV